MTRDPLWKTRSLAVIDKIRSHLAVSAPKIADHKLKVFRKRVALATRHRQVTAIEAELEKLLESQSYYRGAARRSIEAELQKAIRGVKRIIRLLRQQVAWSRWGLGQERKQPRPAS